MWIDKNGILYEGDCQPGDRKATQDEIAADNLRKLAVAMRLERNRRIELLDIEINKLEDAGQDASTLRTKRQALRDVPEQEGFPHDIEWPWTP